MDPLAHRVAARYLRALGNPYLAIEFPSDNARKKYLKDHPRANPSKHTVKKPKKEQGEAGGTEPKSRFFDAAEIAKLPNENKQKTKDPDKLFKAAKEAHKEQLNWLNQGKGLDKTIGATVFRKDKMKEGENVDYDTKGPLIVIGKMKAQDGERTQQKVKDEYGGDWSRLGDIVRSSIAVDTMDDIADVLDKLKKSGLKLARKPKDRFAKPAPGGYRDVMMNVVYPSGHVGEVQLHLKPLIKVKKESHKLYDIIRGVTKGREEDTLTDDERAILDHTYSRMEPLYAEAMKKLGVGGGGYTPKSAMVARVALRAILTMEAQMEMKKGKEKPKKIETQYFDLDGVAVVWEPGFLPKVKQTGAYLHDLVRFGDEAQQVSKTEFEKLSKR